MAATASDATPIPVTVLTGFLGAGKTTLLARLLGQPHGLRIAVIENEFGPESIDSDLLVQSAGEQIVEMNNGCVCCTVRGDLQRILGELIAQKDSGQLRFDRVVIETTGMANPGPVAQTFFMDEAIAARYRLDAIITVVDAKHGHATLDAQPEAQAQVGFADRILMSKTDLVSEEEASSLRQRLLRMNPRASIQAAHMGEVPVKEILDISGFNLDAALNIDPQFLAQQAAKDTPTAAHTHSCDHTHGEHCDHPSHTHDQGAHPHDDAISAFVYESKRPFDAAKLEYTLGVLTQVYGQDMLRYKGVLFVKGSARRLIFQGVHMMMGADSGRPWARGETPSSKMVFIGRALPRSVICKSLDSCLAGAS
ncbi:MAG TPA: GTP-binding protein [Burkholderiaceae bacterium]|nr:GTP-binding protein [Burkholderiaceae bacterium]